MPLPLGTRLGAYEVLQLLGAGAMGEVYRARDTRLERQVALKVLHRDTAADPARHARFLREAQAVAALTHPHIVTLYSSEEADGVRFLTMELVEGRSLAESIPAGGLPWPEFFRIATGLAEALDAAHQKGIVHRDLKPANVMVAADGRAKVLDFGLARIAVPASASPADVETRLGLTEDGAVVGTVPYMSPEQIECRQVDDRSDLFSLGIVLYEMATGVRPFTGESAARVMSAILRDAPGPLVRHRTDAAEPVARLIAHCLEKRPEDRMQTAHDVCERLRLAAAGEPRTWAAVPAAPTGGGSFLPHGQSVVAPEPVAASSRGAEDDAFRVAVLPFTTTPSAGDASVLADALTEDVTAGLSRFPTFSVVAQHSAMQFKGIASDVRRVAEQLGARYIVSGNVRCTGTAVRIGAQLIDTSTGAHLWSETYDRSVASVDLLSVQDDVTDRIVATVADRYGALVRSIGQTLGALPLEQLSTRQLVLWSVACYEHNPTREDHALLRTLLEERVAAEPHYADALVALAHLYCAEYAHDFNPRPDPLGRALRIARRVIALEPSHYQGWEVLAIASFYSRDEDTFRHATERALQLNPRDSNTLAWTGNLLVHAGDYDRGAAQTARAMSLNPHHPGWYHFAAFNRHVSRREFVDALRAARRIGLPEFHWCQFATATAAGHLGRHADAGEAVRALERLAPDWLDQTQLRHWVSRWYWEEDLIEVLVEGVERAKALLRSREPVRTSPSTSVLDRRPASSGDRKRTAAMRELSIAVLPFTCRAAEDMAGGVAEGVREEIIARLARFSYLRVVSTAATAAVSGDADAASRLGARYTLEGAVRSAGTSVRVSVRLTDLETGAHLWAEHFDRDTGAGMFALQDDIANRVVATVANTSGVLARSMAAGLRDRPADALTLEELVLRYYAYLEQFPEDEHATLRDAFERIVEREPGAATAWACLARLYEHEHSHFRNPRPGALERHRQAAERAVSLDPLNQYGWLAVASAHFFARDLAALRATADRGIAINPLHGDHVALAAIFLVCAGDTDRAASLVREASSLNPHHPGWYHMVPSTYHYRREEYEEALLCAKRVNMPLFFNSHAMAAAAAGQLGRRDEARAAFDALARIDARLVELDAIRAQSAHWLWEVEVLDHIMSGIEKARRLAH